MAKRPKKIKIGNGLTITDKQHTSLVEHLNGLIARYESLRSTRVEKFENIDREFNGYLELDEDDKKTEADNRQGKGIKPTPTKLMLADGQIDEIVTYLLSVLVPDSDMYTAVTEKDKQQIAEAFTAVMNQHGDLFDHYSNLAAGFLNALKYNMCGWTVNWEKVHGSTIHSSVTGTMDIVKAIRYEGNSLRNLDVYNLIYDASVPFKQLHSHGEYFGFIEAATSFKVMRMKELGEIFLPEDYDPLKSSTSVKYFKSRPVISTEAFSAHKGTADWFQTFATASGQTTHTNTAGTNVHELTTMYAWMPPKMFGLSEAVDMEIWRFTMLENRYVVSAERLSNAHGFLPISTIRPVDDGFEDQSKSITEKLIPMQRFASFLINIHQHATRKSLYGLNLYDSDMIDLEKIPKQDLMAGYLPTKVTDNKPIERALKQFNDTPDTSGTLTDVASIIDLMQHMVPSNMAQQVAGLERATVYQAAATVQGSNRRNLKLAKIFNAQGMVSMRQMMATNIMQFQPTMDMVDPETKEIIKVDPKKFRETDMVFTISEGLKGIDRLLVVEGLKDVINMLLQSNQAGKIDFVSLIDHWLSMFGDMTDFKQFEFESAIDALDPQQKDIAMQLYQAWLQQQQGGEGQMPQ